VVTISRRFRRKKEKRATACNKPMELQRLSKMLHEKIVFDFGSNYPASTYMMWHQREKNPCYFSSHLLLVIGRLNSGLVHSVPKKEPTFFCWGC